MDAIVEPVRSKYLLPFIAEDVARWFPELGGRALAVSEAQITKDNVPTLPLVIIALTRETSNQPVNTRKNLIDLVDNFVVEFWLKPETIKKTGGGDSPFWAYYDYETIRSTLLTGLTNGYTGPNCERIAYAGMTVESSAFAVVLTFAFRATHTLKTSAPDVPPDGQPITDRTFATGICRPVIECVSAEVIESCCPDPCADIIDKATEREKQSRSNNG